MQSSIYELAQAFLRPEQSAALITWEGDVLHAKSNLAFETTGFKSMVESALKYIQLKPGEILLSNDPYSGGSFLYRYTFLMALSAPDANSPGLVLCVRRGFTPRMSLAEKLDEEGLRIPPTPIFQKGQVTTPILEAMAMHPLSPAGFSAWLQSTIQDLSGYHRKWTALEKTYKSLLSNSEIKRYLQFTQKLVAEKVFEKAQGDARSELRLDSGEILKLHLEIQDGKIKADFGGSTAGIKTFLPDYATFGSCYAAICDFYDLATFKTSGTFAILQVTKPSGCFLNGKYPASTYRGFQIGTKAVYQAMTAALHQIVKNTNIFWSEAAVKMELAFSQEDRWLSEWSAKKMCETVSIEATEARYPVQFERIEKLLEPTGFVVEFQIRKTCQWRWLSDFTAYPARAPKGWKTPSSHELATSSDGIEWKNVASTGSGDLAPGTHVRLTMFSHFTPPKKAEPVL